METDNEFEIVVRTYMEESEEDSLGYGCGFAIGGLLLMAFLCALIMG